MDSTAPVLVVEDDAAVGSLLRLLLEGDGLEIELARTGHQAMKVAAEREPGVAVLDIGLPGLNGVSLAVALRCQHHGLPIIVMSALPEPSVAQAARDCQAAAYFTKPFDTAALLRAVRQALASQEGAAA